MKKTIESTRLKNKSNDTCQDVQSLAGVAAISIADKKNYTKK